MLATLLQCLKIALIMLVSCAAFGLVLYMIKTVLDAFNALP